MQPGYDSHCKHAEVRQEEAIGVGPHRALAGRAANDGKAKRRECQRHNQPYDPHSQTLGDEQQQQEKSIELHFQAKRPQPDGKASQPQQVLQVEGMALATSLPTGGDHFSWPSIAVTAAYDTAAAIAVQYGGSSRSEPGRRS